MTAYVDTSVVLAEVLKEPGADLDLSGWTKLVTSDLLVIEAFRVIDRLRILGKLAESDVARTRELVERFLESVDRASIGAAVVNRASGPFPTVVRGLDAIHLATALLLKEQGEADLVFLTRDRRLALAARACGLPAVGAH